MNQKQSTSPSVRRGSVRIKAGLFYYRLLRYLLWLKLGKTFARTFQTPLPYVCAAHQTPLLRKLSGVDMQYQHNKVVNLKLAVQRIDGIVVKPGEVFSYWRLIGNPTKRKGYQKGIELKSGRVDIGTGGGLCQLSNLIFWMALHTPLTIIERHRHGYDVFPDVSRNQPFGSGATCYYPHGDLMIRNDTDQAFQLMLTVGETNLSGEWRAEHPLAYQYCIVEKNHAIQSEYWGGYSRHNQLYRQTFDQNGEMVDEALMITNAAMMMYSPLIEGEEKA